MTVRVLRSGIHRGEEAVVPGNHRSGMIVLSGCHLSCSFCYTPETSVLKLGTDFDGPAFSTMLHRLESQGAGNIALISPSHVWSLLEPWLAAFRERSRLPLVLKVSGFESPSLVRRMGVLADVFVPDFKVWGERSATFVNLPRTYGLVTARALQEMSVSGRQVVVRHLLMPGFDRDSEAIVDKMESLGYRGYVNFMTCFASKEKGIVRASDTRVASLVQRARAFGMKVLIDGSSVEGLHEAPKAI